MAGANRKVRILPGEFFKAQSPQAQAAFDSMSIRQTYESRAVLFEEKQNPLRGIRSVARSGGSLHGFIKFAIGTAINLRPGLTFQFRETLMPEGQRDAGTVVMEMR